jgi:hypothetical protein
MDDASPREAVWQRATAALLGLVRLGCAMTLAFALIETAKRLPPESNLEEVQIGIPEHPAYLPGLFFNGGWNASSTSGFSAGKLHVKFIKVENFLDDAYKLRANSRSSGLTAIWCTRDSIKALEDKLHDGKVSEIMLAAWSAGSEALVARDEDVTDLKTLAAKLKQRSQSAIVGPSSGGLHWFFHKVAAAQLGPAAAWDICRSVNDIPSRTAAERFRKAEANDAIMAALVSGWDVARALKRHHAHPLRTSGNVRPPIAYVLVARDDLVADPSETIEKLKTLWANAIEHADSESAGLLSWIKEEPASGAQDLDEKDIRVALKNIRWSERTTNQQMLADLEDYKGVAEEESRMRRDDQRAPPTGKGTKPSTKIAAAAPCGESTLAIVVRFDAETPYPQDMSTLESAVSGFAGSPPIKACIIGSSDPEQDQLTEHRMNRIASRLKSPKVVPIRVRPVERTIRLNTVEVFLAPGGSK